MIVLGHRGIPVLCTENTIQSFLKALECGADGLETDVRLTEDGIPVLSHDADLTRVFGADVKIRETPLSKLKDYTIEGQTIPTLEEFLQTIPSGKYINLEIKEAEAGEITVEMSQKLYDGDIIYSSFDHCLINKLKYQHPALNFGYLFDETHINMTIEEFLSLFERNTFSAHLPIDAKQYNSELFRTLLVELRKRGIKIVLWNVNSKDEVEGFDELIDHIITDDVRLFVNSR
ncbi:MAG TPA: glycerophosphodiester phosphodiesterase family protein [Fervidobacterium sp.]|nr:glycerophosphodiester phosphodiesterase family protein [Fervidobacterium sp.]HPT54040.1 glycerophosphodiester phosphodiesterase family protein [Fervidobacterium sp.]HPZ17408.1 glycerophosphodiester phosphodiesterase family protein [Fervidobacterium sp.]HQE48494.1 glycerophosphodiester phosphodiesterase family protein [Fervidobacterium sp.]HUM42269.1 glycerophosphodiester phosphodiesterase family protein [Fervidobacterium sp.]